jgi:hypothetical protein
VRFLVPSTVVQPLPTEPLIKEIPTVELRQPFKADLEKVCSQAELGQIVTFKHYTIHQVLLKSGSDLIFTVQQ